MNSLDVAYLSQNWNSNGLQGCQDSFGNVILYKEKYNTTLEIKNNVLVRYNANSAEQTTFYAPLPLKNAAPDYLKDTLGYIIQNFKSPVFQLITEAQKADLETALAAFYPDHHFVWTEVRDDFDYLYLQQNMVELSGSVLGKKKNHVNRFFRAYEGRWSFKTFAEADIGQDILAVEEGWFTERNGDQSPDLVAEREIIRQAVNQREVLGISGGVLYIDGQPAAMTLASPVSPEVLDIHFEKAFGECVGNGGYAAINNLFAKTCGAYKYLNREEDLGIEGLRKAKLSYKPEILLTKYYGRLI